MSGNTVEIIQYYKDFYIDTLIYFNSTIQLIHVPAMKRRDSFFEKSHMSGWCSQIEIYKSAKDSTSTTVKVTRENC